MPVNMTYTHVMKEMLEVATLSQTCCPSLNEGAISAAQAEAAAAKIKAIADPARLRLLSHIATHGCDDVCVCDFPVALDLSQPTISHHMKKLVEAGLVRREQRGKWAFYSIIPEGFREIRGIIDFG